jgi:hypothetical protein
MFNPLVSDLSILKQDELLKKINELSSKYQRSVNPHLKQQVFVILEQYRQEYRDRMVKQLENDSKNLDKIINIE